MHRNRRITLHQKIGKGIKFNYISIMNPSRDVMVFGQILVAKKTPEIISAHDVWEPLKQALLASCDVIISSQVFVSKLQRFFTLGD